MGQADQAVGPGGHAVGLLAHQVVGVKAGELLHVDLLLAEAVPEPAQAHPAGGEGVHHISIRRCEIMNGHLPVGIIGQLGGGDADGQGGSDVLGEDAGVDVAHADGAGGLVQTAGGDPGLGGDAQELRHLRQNGPHQLAGFPDLRQGGRVDADEFQHLRPIFLGADVPVFRGGQQRALRHELARQQIDDIVLQKQEVPGFGEKLRFIFLDPQEFGGGPAGLEAHLAGDLVALLVAEMGPELFRLFAGPVVHPDNGVFQWLTRLVQQAEGLALYGEAHGGDVPGVHRAAGPNDLHAFHNGVHVDAARRFHNVGLGRQEGVFHDGGSLLNTLVIKDRGL